MKNLLCKKISNHMDLSHSALTIFSQPSNMTGPLPYITIQAGQSTKWYVLWACIYLEADYIKIFNLDWNFNSFLNRVEILSRLNSKLLFKMTISN